MIITAQKMIEVLSKVPPETPLIHLAHSDCGLSFINEPEIRSRESIAIDDFLGKAELDRLEECETEEHELFVFID